MASKKLSAVITIGGAVAGSLKSAFGTVKTEADRVGQAIKNLEGRQKALGQAIQQFGRDGKNIDGMRQRYADVTAQVERLRAAQTSLLGIQQRITANQEKQSKIRGQIGETAMVGAALAVPVFTAFNKAAEFNREMKIIGNTADLTDAQIKQLGTDLLYLSDATGQSAVDMRGAIGFLVAAGQDVATAQENMRTIGRTATATASNIEDVAKASFTLGDALKIDPTQMQKALDVLVQSGKEGNFEFKAMAENLPTLGSSFQALGMGGIEAVASMGAALQIARKGAANEAEAANNMRNFLAKILSPDTLKKAEKLGSDLYGVVSGAQAKGENPLEAALAEIDRITKGGDQKLIGELFGDMQVQNFIRPMLQNLKEYEGIKQRALAADGVSARDFERMMGTSDEVVSNLKESLWQLHKVLGDAVEPMFTKASAALTPIVRAGRDFIVQNPKLVGGVVATTGALIGLRMAVLGGRLAMLMMGAQGLKFSAMLARMRVGAAMAGGAMPKIAMGVRAVGAAFISTGIGALVAGLAVGGLMIYRHWDGVKAFMVGTFQGIKSGLEPVVTVFRNFWQSLAPIHPMFDAIGGVIRQAWDWFTGLFGPVTYSAEALGKAGEAGKSFGEALAAGINFVLTPLQLLIQGITWVNNNIGAALDKALAFKDAAAGKIGVAWDSTKSFFGLGDDQPASGAGSLPAPSLPAPAMATAGGTGAQTYTDQSQTTIQVVQQPGESSRDLARRIAEEQERQRAIRARSNMLDGATTQ